MRVSGSGLRGLSIMASVVLGLVIVGLLVTQVRTSGPSQLETARSITESNGGSSPGASLANSSSIVGGGLGELHNVTFYEGESCGGLHLVEWGVRLGTWSKTEPSNITISQIPENGGLSDNTFNQTTITFTVPSGAYVFTLYPMSLEISSPNGFELGGATGVVTVDNFNIAIYTLSPSARCG